MRRDHLVDARHDHVEEDDELVVVLGSDLEPANLGQALERHVAELGHLEELQARGEGGGQARVSRRRSPCAGGGSSFNRFELAAPAEKEQARTRVMRWSMTGVSKM